MINFRVAVSVKHSKSDTYKVPWWIIFIFKAAVYVVGFTELGTQPHSGDVQWVEVEVSIMVKLSYNRAYNIHMSYFKTFLLPLHQVILRFMNSFPFPATGGLCFSHHPPLSLSSHDYRVKDLHLVVSVICICVPEPWRDLTHSDKILSAHNNSNGAQCVGFVAVKLLSVANLICQPWKICIYIY